MTNDMQQIELYGLTLDVEYTHEFIKDVYGTRDSPDMAIVTVHRVELAGSRENIVDLLSASVLLEIEDRIADIERDDWDE
jgi:hypothetical protein